MAENTTIGETFAKHFNALHSSRRAFIQAESSERIRRALRHKIRLSREYFEHGDKCTTREMMIRNGRGLEM